ncbi:MAG TPA: hypothetical protein VE954_32260 [Oligoflexus sp.]|uniref:hypothetical protein n=1 Tax=Oligoflexus sp. TaxID=1971216 RepID=UPI002D3DB871|nr:hypothetical protein [Oligoflexus sp.]HYX37801.1 hypothetical protein [Oligoflexus sp.]
MLRTTVLGTCLFLASASFAAPQRQCRWESTPDGGTEKVCYEYVNEERVLEGISVTPANGGFNPEFSAYNVSGSVLVAGNPCLAQGLDATLEQETKGRRNFVVARVKGWRREGVMCSMIADPVTRFVSTTVRGQKQLISNTFIKNAEEFGNVVTLDSYIP